MGLAWLAGNRSMVDSNLCGHEYLIPRGMRCFSILIMVRRICPTNRRNIRSTVAQQQ